MSFQLTSPERESKQGSYNSGISLHAYGNVNDNECYTDNEPYSGSENSDNNDRRGAHTHSSADRHQSRSQEDTRDGWRMPTRRPRMEPYVAPSPRHRPSYRRHTVSTNHHRYREPSRPRRQSRHQRETTRYGRRMSTHRPQRESHYHHTASTNHRWHRAPSRPRYPHHSRRETDRDGRRMPTRRPRMESSRSPTPRHRPQHYRHTTPADDQHHTDERPDRRQTSSHCSSDTQKYANVQRHRAKSVHKARDILIRRQRQTAATTAHLQPQQLDPPTSQPTQQKPQPAKPKAQLKPTPQTDKLCLPPLPVRQAGEELKAFNNRKRRWTAESTKLKLHAYDAVVKKNQILEARVNELLAQIEKT